MNWRGEMVAGILIISVSLVLLSYWLRYTCLLVLRNSTEELFAADTERAAPFGPACSFGSSPTLDDLERSLDRDYRVLTYLVQHASRLRLDSFEERLLVWDYRLMRCWYRLARIAAPRQAGEALSEMASVLDVLFGRLSNRASFETQA